MPSILFVILLICFQINVISNLNIISNTLIDYYVKIDPGISKTVFIEYQRETNFIFNITEQEALQINIHGINCNFALDFNGSLIDKKNLNTYSLVIDSNNNYITISPLIDVIEGEFKENYFEKSCPLSINSFLIKNDNHLRLQIENKEDNWIHLHFSNYNLLTLIYEIKEILSDSFLALSFRINKKSHFSIDITYENNNNQNKTLNKNIYDSSYIYLNTSFLYFNEEDYEENKTVAGGVLSINIIPEDVTDINMILKLLKKILYQYLKKML